MNQTWFLPSRGSQRCKNPAVIFLAYAVLIRTLWRNYIQVWSPFFFFFFNEETLERVQKERRCFQEHKIGSVRKKLKRPVVILKYMKGFEEKNRGNKTSLNDSMRNFCLAQEFLDNQVNRILELVTEGVPGALSWKKKKKKVLMNWRFQVTDIDLPEGRVWMTSLWRSAPALGSIFLRTESGLSSSITPRMICSWEVALNVAAWPPDWWPHQVPPPGIQELSRAAKQASIFQQPRVGARAYLRQSLWL